MFTATRRNGLIDDDEGEENTEEQEAVPVQEPAKKRPRKENNQVANSASNVPAAAAVVAADALLSEARQTEAYLVRIMKLIWLLVSIISFYPLFFRIVAKEITKTLLFSF